MLLASVKIMLVASSTSFIFVYFSMHIFSDYLLYVQHSASYVLPLPIGYVIWLFLTGYLIVVLHLLYTLHTCEYMRLWAYWGFYSSHYIPLLITLKECLI